VIHTFAEITRAELDHMFDDTDLSEFVRPRLMSVLDGAGVGQTCMALYHEHPTELATFLLRMFQHHSPAEAEHLAAHTQVDGCLAYWPGWVIAGELSPEQEADTAREASELELAGVA
jgi:hypothetical protein